MRLPPVGGVIAIADQTATNRMMNNCQTCFWVMEEWGSGLGLGWLTSAFGNLGDGGFEDLHFGIGGTDAQAFVFHPNHHADDAAAGGDLVAGLEGFEHFFVLSLLLALRGSHQCEHDDQRQDHWQKTPQALRRTLRALREYHSHQTQSHISL